jgi:hypothetical protein
VGYADQLRASRDGDRFHYYWAACRALRLLDLTGDLKAIGVEGLPEGEEVEGEEVIDVAEYHGGRDAETCTWFRYTQLKHSTMRTDQFIVASEGAAAHEHATTPTVITIAHRHAQCRAIP